MPRAAIFMFATAALTVAAATCFFGRISDEPLRIASNASLPLLEGDRLSIITWNLGYGGLGKETDFVADGGVHLRAADAKLTSLYAHGIRDWVANADAEVFVFQEIARGGYLNRGEDLISSVTGVLEEFEIWYQSAFQVRIPFLFTADMGNALALRRLAHKVEVATLPSGGLCCGWSRRFPVIAATIAGHERDIVVMSVHLAAFDKHATLRKRQLLALFDFARRKYAGGALVAIGGDFNFEFASPPVKHSTPSSDLEWVHTFPVAMLPSGWTLVADPLVGTVRSLNQPFVKGENYVGVIDGFILSPGFAVDSIATADLGFEFSDHNPVKITLSIID